jgi:hypothetical protein
MVRWIIGGFGGIYSVHLQGRKIIQAKKPVWSRKQEDYQKIDLFLTTSVRTTKSLTQISKYIRISGSIKFALPTIRGTVLPLSFMLEFKWLTWGPWRRRQYNLPKYWWTSSRLHGLTSQNMEFFIATRSLITWPHFFFKHVTSLLNFDFC